MARYLITGGAGFIGSNLVEELLKRGEFVRVIDNFSTGRRSNLTPFMQDIELIEGSIEHYHTVAKAVREVDYVLHQAALPSVPRSINDPIASNGACVNGTLNLLHASVEARVKRFVYASSSSVYGDSGTGAKFETQMPNPKSPYAVAKMAGEYYCRVFFQLYGLETVSLRYFNVFGPRQDPNSHYSAVIPKFLKLILEGKPPQFHGDGTQTRDFTYVANNVHANLLACEVPNVGGKVFNIACGSAHSLVEMVDILNKLTGRNVKPLKGEPRAGDIHDSLADISAAREQMNYHPLVDFRGGLEKLVEVFAKTEQMTL
jgi:UDP-glucose 4-epimerase